jgi:hypothetical protein
MNNFLKYALLLYAVIFCIGKLFSQTPFEKEHAMQHHKIDSLNKELTTAKKNEKINCLLQLSFQYYILNTDLAFHFANMALKDAEGMNNKRSIGQSYQILGQIMQERGNLESGFCFLIFFTRHNNRRQLIG